MCDSTDDAATENNYNHLLIFNLPFSYRPGTDIMSKLILQNPEVMKMLIKIAVGDDVVDEYNNSKTEWKSGTRSDMVITAKPQSLPPIIVEVQNVVNETFILRLNEYCLNCNDEYGRKPVSIIFGVKNTTKIIHKESTIRGSTTYARSIPCYPWAKECILLDAETIKEHINEKPLKPLVALTIFFTQQKQNIRDCIRNDDITIQRLYEIAKSLYETQIHSLELLSKDFNSVQFESEKHMSEAVEILLKNNENNENNKRAISVLREGIKIVDEYAKRHKSQHGKASSSSSSLTPVPAPLSSPTTSVTISDTSSLQQQQQQQQSSQSQNINFIISYMGQLNGRRMDWKDCLSKGVQQGLFNDYQDGNSLKAMYYRYKRASKNSTT